MGVMADMTARAAILWISPSICIAAELRNGRAGMREVPNSIQTALSRFDPTSPLRPLACHSIELRSSPVSSSGLSPRIFRAIVSGLRLTHPNS
jgi:hypothetical protein